MPLSQEPIRALITGAAGQIGYSLIPIIARGDVFGRDQKVILHLLDIPIAEKSLGGVVMEIDDCAFPLVDSVVATTDLETAFKNIDAAFLVGAMPRKPGQERKDLLAANVRIFKSQGEALAKWAKPDVKVLVVGNPANTNALVCAHYAAPKIPKSNFTAMTRLDQNRALAQVAQRNNVPVEAVRNVIIWGNHSSTQFPDVSNATADGTKLPFKGHDPALIELVQKRGAAIINARGLSSAMSAAKAASDHMRDLFLGTSDVVSIGVSSDGNPYGVPEGIIFSFPCKVDPATRVVSIVPGFEWDDVAKEKIAATSSELQAEREEAFEAVKSQ